jgi:hypothetical protein
VAVALVELYMALLKMARLPLLLQLVLLGSMVDQPLVIKEIMAETQPLAL